MKITKQQLKQIIKEELSMALNEELNDILKKLSNPKQREHIKAALNASGVFELDPIKDKKEIKSIINNLRARNADEVLDFILVQIADQVLKVNV